MRRRHYLIASSGLMASAIGSFGAIADTNRGVSSIQAETEPLRFEGSGASVTDEFELESGVTVAEAVHDGESNFIVDLVPTDNGREELLINVIGTYDGASGILAAQGPYLLDIDADGNWEIDLRQPRATDADAETLPVELEDETSTWNGPFLFDGLGQARGTHDGAGNFIVEILPQEGRFSELVFNEIGVFVGETTFDLEGIGYVTVDADGPWSITME
ncbi:hypothetical protein [Natronorubrum bangense]|uniref:Cell surface glycoprotein n=2 Tax=Natronorubrum bangense TaxID=61858 RepID=L9WSY2_9EURY|nr:hypothetical protein [Natronorubrum bangense]ELY51438.1 hypothetical protein C494_03810 [Natronorubrum bangense JCM 10635]